MITLVIARQDETLDWLNELPTHCEVKVCNAGAALDDPHLPPNVEEISTQASTPEGSHIEWLIRLKDRLADAQQPGLDLNGWTVFAAGDALQRAPALLELLSQPQNWGEVQPLGLCGAGEASARDDRREWVGGQPVRIDRYCLHTLAAIGRFDAQAQPLAELYRHRHALPAGENLLAHFLGLIGRHDLALSAGASDLGVSATGGVFAIRNDRLLALLQGNGAPLAKLEVLLHGDPVHRCMLERCWLHLFGLPFVSLAPLPRPTPTEAPQSRSLARVVASIDALLARSGPACAQRSVSAADAVRRVAPARRTTSTGTGLRLSAIAALDEPRAGRAPATPAWMPDLSRIGQIGARLREHALS